MLIVATMANSKHSDFAHSLGLRIEILYLQKLQFTIGGYLFDIHFLGVFDVRRAFVWIREYDPVGLHAVLHHLPDFLLFRHITYTC